MGFTARQLEIVEILKSGVAFLESQPKKEKYTLRDIVLAAGDEIHAPNLYAMIKQLKKKQAKMELAELKEIFGRLNIQVGPLEDREEMHVDPEPDYLVLEPQNAPSEPESSDPMPEPEPEHRKPEPVFVREPPSFENEINSLSVILKTLAPLTRDMRMNVLAAAESFYGIGH